MFKAIAVSQSIYKRQGRVFADGLSEPVSRSRRTDERGPRRQRSAGNEVSSCHETADNRASEQDNSFAASSDNSGSQSVPQGNVDHRGNPPTVVVVEEKSVLTYVSELESKVENLDRYLQKLAEGLD